MHFYRIWYNPQRMIGNRLVSSGDFTADVCLASLQLLMFKILVFLNRRERHWRQILNLRVRVDTASVRELKKVQILLRFHFIAWLWWYNTTFNGSGTRYFYWSLFHYAKCLLFVSSSSF